MRGDCFGPGGKDDSENGLFPARWRSVDDVDAMPQTAPTPGSNLAVHGIVREAASSGLLECDKRMLALRKRCDLSFT
jgi:hypothetical protein